MPNIQKEPVALMPPVYELPLIAFSDRRWCKMEEVLELVPVIAKYVGNDFHPTAAELIRNFAALTKFNKRPSRRKKIFRYSVDGTGLSGKEVPVVNLRKKQFGPPHDQFYLDIEPQKLKTIFVTEQWVADTLRAIRLGAVSAAIWSHPVGYRPKGNTVIDLSTRRNRSHKM